MMLNTADIPNLFPADERAEICDKMQGIARQISRKIESTPMALYNFFIERVRSALHIVLAFSPIGDAFRNRLRMFPSLINCCTIDWFTSWPEDALEMVAKKFLEEVDLEDEIRTNCVVSFDLFRRKKKHFFLFAFLKRLCAKHSMKIFEYYLNYFSNNYHDIIMLHRHLILNLF
jgi:dynein heavy chain